MTTPLQVAYTKLRKIRESKDLKLRKTPLLRETIRLPDGREIPFELRYYQIQGVLHLCVMDRFLLGDDCGLGKCAHRTSLVRTDQGLMELGDLRQNSWETSPDPGSFEPAKNIRVWTGWRWADVKRFYYEGTAPSIKLTTNRGYHVEGSLQHPVFVRGPEGEGWMRLPDLRQDRDYICIERRTDLDWPAEDAEIPAGSRTFHANARQYELPGRFTPELAALLGYYVSEGNRECLLKIREAIGPRPGGVIVAVDFSGVELRIATLLRQNHDETQARIRDLLRSVCGWEGKAVDSGILKEVFDRCGASAVLSEKGRLPALLFRCTKSTVRTFLRTLFEGDGSVGRARLEYRSKSEHLIRELQVLLLQFGAVCSRSSEKVGEEACWRLSLEGESASQFMREIGFVSDRNLKGESLFEGSDNPNLDIIPHVEGPVGRLWAKLVSTSKCGPNKNPKGSGVKQFGNGLRNAISEVIRGVRDLSYPTLAEFLDVCESQGLAGDPDFQILETVQRNRFFYDPIKSIETSTCELMDLEIDHEDHSFVANGLVNHNTPCTITALCHLWSREPNVKAIILTDKSVVPQWASEFAKFCHVDQMCVLQCVGTPTQRRKIYDQFIASEKPTALILTYATARRDVDILLAFEGFSLICDEATAFKETTSTNYKVVAHLARKCRRMWALTATLLKNRLTEGFGIYSILVPGLFPKSKSKFIEDYCIVRMQGIPGTKKQFPIILGPRARMVPVFRDLIDPYYLGRAKMEVAADLPPLTMREHFVDMTPEQLAKYSEALKGFLIREKTDLENKVDPLTAVNYCQQIVNHLALVDCDGPSAKFEALFELLTGGDLADEKVIVFSRFERMISLIEAEAKKRKVKTVRITGAEKTAKERNDAQTAFMDPDSGVRVCLITTAAEQGLNLQCAKAIIFFDTPWSAGSYLQILGRMIRIGSTQDHCYAIHMIARRSIDTRVMQVLQTKYKLLEAVLGKRIKGADDDVAMVPENNDISVIYRALLAEAMV